MFEFEFMDDLSSGTVIFRTRSRPLKLFLSNLKSMPLSTLTGAEGIFCRVFCSSETDPSMNNLTRLFMPRQRICLGKVHLI